MYRPFVKELIVKTTVFLDAALRSLRNTNVLDKITTSIIGVTSYPDDGGSKLHWNVGQYLPDYIVQYPIIQQY